VFKEKYEKRREGFSKEALPLMDKLYNTAFMLTNNVEDAKDLVQDTFFLDIPIGTVSEYLLRARKAGLTWPLPNEQDNTALEQRLFPPTHQ